MPLTRTCRISGKEFIISDQEISLLEKLSPIIGGEKFNLPLPSICPEERLRRRAQFKNYFFLHKRKCDYSGKSIVSTFSKDSPYTVWNQKDWWSDALDGLSYGQDIDWSKSISEQWSTLMTRVPQVTLDNAYLELENSEYINGNGSSKDCYLISCGNGNDKCLYAYFLFSCSNIAHVNYGRFSENCTFSNHLFQCFNVHYAFDANECRDARYIFSCQGCQNILGCVGLKNQQYYILNQPCTPDEFEATLEKLKYDELFAKDFEQKVLNLIKKEGIKKSILTGSMNCTGDFCYDSKNCQDCIGSSSIEDCVHVHDCYNTNDSLDISNWGESLTLSYDSIAVGENSSHIYWSQGCWGNAQYHFFCQNCGGGSFLFGCSGIQKKSYCIFNKQYSKEEWEETVKKIIQRMIQEGTWGEFMSAKYSWYPYDASYAMTLFPLTEKEVLNRGLVWSGYEMHPEGVTKTIPAERLPYDIRKIPDDILNWALLCKKTRKPYKIQKIELELHRKLGIPLSTIHPNERIQQFFEWDKRIFSFYF